MQAFQAVDGAGVARVDFLLNEADGCLYVNEINTLPGSLSFYLWEASGLPFPRLVDELIGLALERHAERRRTSFTIDSEILQQFGSGGAKGKLRKSG